MHVTMCVYDSCMSAPLPDQLWRFSSSCAFKTRAFRQVRGNTGHNRQPRREIKSSAHHVPCPEPSRSHPINRLSLDSDETKPQPSAPSSPSGLQPSLELRSPSRDHPNTEVCPAVLCIAPCSLTATPIKRGDTVSPSYSSALCTVMRTLRGETRASWRWNNTQGVGAGAVPTAIALRSGEGAPKLPTAPFPLGVRDGRCFHHCTTPKLSWVVLSLVESGTQSTESLTKRCLRTLFLPQEAPLFQIQNPPTDKASGAALPHLRGSPQSPASCTVPLWKEINTTVPELSWN